jgi:hypothetical protein
MRAIVPGAFRALSIAATIAVASGALSAQPLDRRTIEVKPSQAALQAQQPQVAVPNASPWFAPLLSAVVPGAGQGWLRQQRAVAYIAAEGYLILQAVRSSRDASRERDAYREIARSVARAGVSGDRPVGPWSYYERMQTVLESGAYNRTPQNGFSPETDPATFNGFIWQLARETYWLDPDNAPDVSSPEYQRALAFYRNRAAGDAFLWSWRDAQLEQDLYRQTIARSNDASRRTSQFIGLLLANHALSLVDAYVSVRLRVYGGQGAAGEQRVGISGSIPFPARRD